MAITNVTTHSTPTKGITYSVITDSSADWAGVSSNTYFYDLGEDRVLYKDTSGTILNIFLGATGDSHMRITDNNIAIALGTTAMDSSLMFNESVNFYTDGTNLKAFYVGPTGATGTLAIGGSAAQSGIYYGSGTVPTSVTATLTDTLTFDSGKVIIQNSSASQSFFEVLGRPVYTGLTPYMRFNENGGLDLLGSNSGDGALRIFSGHPSSQPQIFKVDRFGGGIWSGGTVEIGLGTSNASLKVGSPYMSFYRTTAEEMHRIGTSTGSGNVHYQIFRNGFTFGGKLMVGSSTAIGSEEISLQGSTLVNDKFEIQSTTSGFLMPRLTTAQMNAIAAPDTHLLVFNTDLNGIYRYNGSAWVALSTGYGIIGINDSSGQPTFYADMQTAVTAAGAGGVLTLYSNITQSSTITLPAGTGIDFTINGNGYTITHTSDTGSEYQLFLAGGSSQTLYLNNIKIISNGTSTAGYSSSVFGYSPAITNVICSSDTYIYALNNNIKDFGTIYGGKLEAVNGYVNFSSTVRDATVVTKYTRGSVINCHVTVNTGGNIGLLGNIINCNVIGDAVNGVLVLTENSKKIWNSTIEITSGSNSGISVSSAGWNGEPNILNCRVIHRGTGVGVRATYIASIKDTYIYAEGNQALYAQNTTQTGGYNLENVILETNATNQPAFDRLDSGSFRMKNVTATCLNATNTAAAFDIRVSGANKLYMENCSANVNNPSVDNLLFQNNSITTGGAFIYNLTMSEIGNGLNLATVPLLNVNTPDAYGNIKLG